MTATLLEQASKLPVPERLRLVEDLWESIAHEVEREPIPGWLVEELERRDAALDANPASGVSVEEIERTLFPPR
jgi:putative addiction module component (TIGR02574 family)